MFFYYSNVQIGSILTYMKVLCDKCYVTSDNTAMTGNFVEEVSHLNFPKIPPEQTFNRRVDIKP